MTSPRSFYRWQLFLQVLLVTGCVLAARAEKQAEPGFVLKQNSKIVGKDLTIYVTARAIRWSNRTGGIEVVSTGPNWRVATFNRRTKRIHVSSAEEFHCPYGNRTSRIFGKFAPDALPFEFYKTEKLFDVKTSVYKFQAARKGTIPSSARYWCLRVPSLDRRAYAVISKIYTFKPDGVALGIPVQFLVKHSPRSKGSTNLTTREIKKQMIDRSVFHVPKGYRPVEQVEEVLRDLAAEEFIDSLMQGRSGK